ncbi:hypothetical protein RFI_07866, partial [Reticulomyxa filosa]
RLYAACFYHEGTKKKVIFQLLGEFVHYFRSVEDSFSFERYSVKNLKSSIQEIDTQLSLVITTADETLFRVQSMSGNFMELVECVFFCFSYPCSYVCVCMYSCTKLNTLLFSKKKKKKRQSTAFYSSQYCTQGKPLKPKSSALEVVHFTLFYMSFSNVCPPNCTCRLLKREKLTVNELKEAKILGLASKKGGGGVAGYKTRWWVLHDGFLYYFKEDFRNNKKVSSLTPEFPLICFVLFCFFYYYFN